LAVVKVKVEACIVPGSHATTLPKTRHDRAALPLDAFAQREGENSAKRCVALRPAPTPLRPKQIGQGRQQTHPGVPRLLNSVARSAGINAKEQPQVRACLALIFPLSHAGQSNGTAMSTEFRSPGHLGPRPGCLEALGDGRHLCREIEEKTRICSLNF